jgi:imidazolonepropionase-like amidohydrolase/Tol biopolymer transport system component
MFYVAASCLKSPRRTDYLDGAYAVIGTFAILSVGPPSGGVKKPTDLVGALASPYRPPMRLFPYIAAGSMLAASAVAQVPQSPDSGPPRRDPTNTLPTGPTRSIRFTTDQGTWMSVDVSPDGSRILFDHLGDIYTVPITGGKATRILGGNSIDAQPRFSPDGRSIVFTSDRNGTDGTWIADADGRRPRLVSPGGHYPDFTPDGRQIVTANRFVDVRGGAGLTIPGFGTAPSFTSDGRYIWFQSGTQAGRFDREKGTVGYRTGLAGGVYRPMVSPDGKRLAYFTRFEAKSALVVRDLDTGAERWVSIGLQPEAGTPPPAPFVPQLVPPAGGGRAAGPPPVTGVGPLPSSSWTPDGNAVVTSFGGKIWRIEVPSGRRTEIPISVDVEQTVGTLVKGTVATSDSVLVREIREPALSPDGKRVAFSAIGKLWLMDLPGGKPRRLTTAVNVVESSPAWTPDGQSIVYATWVDGLGGDIHQISAAGGASKNLTMAPAMYSRLNFTPSGSKLVFARAPRFARTARVDETAPAQQSELNFELRWMSPSGGVQHSIAMVEDVGALPLGGFPHFTADTSRVFFHGEGGLQSVRWDGSDRKVVLASAAPQTVLSPDGVHVLSRAGRRGHVYLFEIPRLADSLVIDPSIATSVLPTRRLTRAGGEFPSWSRDGSKAIWTHGSTLFVYDVAAGDKATADSLAAAGSRPAAAQPGAGGQPPAAEDSARRPGGADSTTRWAPAFDATSHEVKITVASDNPAGSIVLRGARVITMKGREVIENADVVVTGNRIVGVGSRGTVVIPKGARSIDVSRKTILPGYVDVHANTGAPMQVHRTMLPQYLANLTYGVTTLRDVQASSTDVFTYADRLAVGDVLGPRLFATGPAAIDSAARVTTLAEGRTFITPFANAYRPGTIRGDLIAQRADRRRFLNVARELGLTAVAVGTPDFKKSLSVILDGYADHQAAYEIFPIHGDVAKLIAESGMTYTPILLGRVGSRNGYEYMLASEKPHNDPRLARFYYHRDLDRQSRGRGTWIVPEEYPFADIARGAAQIAAAGGKVAVGTNGRMQGLGVHWDMWLLAKSGMSNYDVLMAATLNGADAIGAAGILGSIEAGKLADLQVLDANPLTDIRNSNSVRFVMKNGRLYDAATMDQIAPTRTKMAAPWWLALDPSAGDR